MTDIEWTYAKCPICRRNYPYIEGGYKPKTCSNFDCLHKFLHLEVYSKEVMPIKNNE